MGGIYYQTVTYLDVFASILTCGKWKCLMTSLKMLIEHHNTDLTMRSSDTPFPVEEFVVSELLELERIGITRTV